MTTHIHASTSIEDEPIPARPALALPIGAVPMRFRVVAAIAAALIVLMVVGVPLSAIVPFAGLAGCLGMHLFMGHGGHTDHSHQSD